LDAVADVTRVNDSRPACSGSEFLGGEELRSSQVDPGSIAVGRFVNRGADASDAHAVEGDVAIGWSLMSNGGRRIGRFRKRINTTPNAMAMAIPPMMPPTIAGTFDLREDAEGGVEVETINSGFMVMVEKDPVGKGTVDLAGTTNGREVFVVLRGRAV